MRRAGLWLLVVLGGACGEQTLAEATCPPGGTTLTYEGFGRPFFAAHCVYCHGGPHGHSSRAFNTVELIRAQRARIYVNAVGENPPMPPGPDDPSAQERARLEEWLACGAP